MANYVLVYKGGGMPATDAMSPAISPRLRKSARTQLAFCRQPREVGMTHDERRAPTIGVRPGQEKAQSYAWGDPSGDTTGFVVMENRFDTLEGAIHADVRQHRKLVHELWQLFQLAVGITHPGVGSGKRVMKPGEPRSVRNDR